MKKCSVGRNSIFIYWTRYAKTCLRAYAANEGRDHPALTQSLGTTECMNGRQRPGLYFARAQDDLRMLRLFEGTFRLSWPNCQTENDL